jgi:hypothetical protein
MFAAFDALVRDHADALFVGGDTFFDSRRVQFAILAARCPSTPADKTAEKQRK